MMRKLRLLKNIRLVFDPYIHTILTALLLVTVKFVQISLTFLFFEAKCAFVVHSDDGENTTKISFRMEFVRPITENEAISIEAELHVV